MIMLQVEAIAAPFGIGDIIERCARRAQLENRTPTLNDGIYYNFAAEKRPHITDFVNRIKGSKKLKDYTINIYITKEKLL